MKHKFLYLFSIIGIRNYNSDEDPSPAGGRRSRQGDEGGYKAVWQNNGERALRRWLNAMKRYNCLSFILVFMMTTPLMALPDDKNQPLHVIADKVIVNYAEGVTNLEGNVKVTQGSTILLGNKVIVTTDKNQQLVKLIAYGDTDHQASYETIPSPHDSPFHATADIITYLSAKKLAIFKGNAHATDGINQFDGPAFEYFTDEQKVVTEKVANQHASIIIYPGTKH